MIDDEIIKEAYASAPDDVIVYDTLEINHPSFITPILVVRSYEKLVNNGKEFLPFAFEFSLPPTEPGTNPELVIRIDNVSAVIADNLAQAVESLEPVQVTYRNFIAGASDAQYEFPFPMEVFDVTVIQTKVIAKCVYPDLVNKPFPNEVYTIDRFPGLLR